MWAKKYLRITVQKQTSPFYLAYIAYKAAHAIWVMSSKTVLAVYVNCYSELS